MQHQDPRLAQAAPQFPPQGFTGAPVPAYQDPAQHQDIQTVPVAEQSDSAEYETVEYQDYFGFNVTHRFMMPDGRQWIEFKELNEGDIARYQAILNRDITVEKRTGNARIKVNQVEERHALLIVAVTGWHMMRRDGRGKWVEVNFNSGRKDEGFVDWLGKADPRIIADLDSAVRKFNPFLLQASTETLEAIDKQIEELQEQRAEIVERMRGEADSATS